MASPLPYFGAQNKGTLVPGQSIAVNKYTVQVERYLSQGKYGRGFAHVYLVRTATPVYSTTHHVLKRIAVANEAMLTEVKKEVDIMRLLKGHPNIVHLIDAAWHKIPNGTYEVFILMEFCPGGGIIDMMNRRLRERLTEAEILQIFVDVCEGVAFMHNLRPPLLHRDLKVENILQSSPTSFKLCDFGSATIVSRPPTTTLEIRALEADLNRHTTLQYRAPEMIDVYQRKPVDEKSDVWALGVLLYKLCYYTTPFEEHGPLAILNVQYRIPSYPVYSPQMNELIGSMLQEHGVRRPSVFELLDHVHRLRGTKSRFHYTIPVPQPLSPYRPAQFKPASRSSPANAATISVPKSLPMTITHSKARQAREQVMDAIDPMPNGNSISNTNSTQTPGSSNTKYFELQQTPPIRRGRPTIPRSLSTSKASNLGNTATPQVAGEEKPKNWLDNGFAAEEDAAWKVLSASDTSQTTSDRPADAWKVDETHEADMKRGKRQGFGDSFSNNGLDSSNKDPNAFFQPTVTMKRASPSPRSHGITQQSVGSRDAFEGLGLALSSRKPAPTLGEARKLRTGLAVLNANGFRNNNDGTGKTALLLPPSPFKSPSPSIPYSSPFPSSGTSPSLKAPVQAGRRSPGSSPAQEALSTESRFPSLEELDANFSLTPMSLSPNPNESQTHPPLRRKGSTMRSDKNATGLIPESLLRGAHNREGTRSQQVTGFSMRDLSSTDTGRDVGQGFVDVQKDSEIYEGGSSLNDRTESRPAILRRDRSSFLAKSGLQAPAPLSRTDQITTSPLSGLSSAKPVDWLTGDDDNEGSPSPTMQVSSAREIPVLRDSPRKRASVIIPEDTRSILDGVIAEHGEALLPSNPRPVDSIPSKYTGAPTPFDDKPRDTHITKKHNPISHSASEQSRDIDSSSSADEGPEDAGSSNFGRIIPNSAETPKRRSRKGRQSSVHDLVDLYGGGVTLKDKAGEISFQQEMDMTPHPPKVHQTKSPTTPSNPNLTPRNPLRSPFTFPSRPVNGDVQPKQLSTKGPTTSPSRSRPQSMFIFPSKSSDGLSPTSGHPPLSAGLNLPEEMKHTRRTSISDMVQHFEVISGAKSLLSVQRPVSRMPPVSADLGGYPRGQSSKEKEKPALAVPSDNVPRPPSKSPTRIPPGLLQSTNRAPAPPYDNPPSDAADESLRLKLPKPSLSQKPTDISPVAERAPSPAGSSPSERSYQGVGKLIAQWQQKSVGADSARGVVSKRGAHGVKRGGI